MASRRTQTPRPRAVKAFTPLNQRRLAAGLTIPQLAESFGVSKACVSRWLSGHREAPPDFIRAVWRAAAGDPEALAQEQARYCERRAQRVPVVAIELALPDGVDPDHARKICVAALAEARGGVG